jgi:hypothetical protein
MVHLSWVVVYGGLSEAVHQREDFSDIDIDRTELHTTSTADTCHAFVVLVHIVFQLVHESLPYALGFLRPGIMARAMQSKKGEHTGIPVPDAISFLAMDLVLDIETPARRTEIGAGTAVDAGEAHLVPKRCFEEFDNLFGLKLVRRDDA